MARRQIVCKRRRYGAAALRRSTRAVELALLGHAFERFTGALDAVLVIVAVRRKKLHDPVSAIRRHVADRPGREIDGLTKLVFVFLQR